MSKVGTIAVVGRYPHKHLLKDGMMQRIKEIDGLLPSHARIIYLNLSFKNNRHYKMKKISSEVFEITANVVLHYGTIKAILNRSNLVYCHSIMNYIYISLFQECYNNLILDVHGVVPEELKMEGKVLHSKIFSFIEMLAFGKASHKIYVSRNMELHYKNKYGSNDGLVLPIFSSESKEIQSSHIDANERFKFVYVGGVQKWQNIQQMIDFAEKYSDCFNFEFYLPEEHLSSFTSKKEGIKFSTASQEQLSEIYLSSDFGLILRDENIVNKVSSPTKLGEYLKYGLIPVIIQPDIGDFSLSQYSYILISDISRVKDMDSGELLSLKKKNKEIYDLNEEITKQKTKILAKLIEEMAINDQVI